MANERNTETIVRNLLAKKGYASDRSILIEYQKSEHKKVKSCLKKASKRGTGRAGYPEVIITFANNPRHLVVIECKAAVSQHKSSNIERYEEHKADYAVDGALWYAAHLKEEFNVTAIAISGETEKEKKITAYLWLKKGHDFVELPTKTFPAPSEIERVVEEQEKPLSQEDLIKKANEYNDELAQYSVPETERCTLMSAMLIALQHKPFRVSYLEYSHTQNERLIKELLSACESVLYENGLTKDKIETIINEFSKFKNNTTFTEPFESQTKKPNTIFRDLIESIHKNIFSHIQNNDFDILGQFYTVFIRYAGSDAKTGLVLTPSHITDFFCEVANLTTDDTVYDPCCGTGGFLVSAMNYMVKRAGMDSQKKKNIKLHQLVGIETRSDMFAHVCSNMMMRGDGKSNIIKGDCFDESHKQEIKKHNPTVTFLNPPYNLGNDRQLEFLEVALECIQRGGRGIAICQMGTVVSNHKSVRMVKERLLTSHTLEAVFSMPTELFNPAASAPSCILVFTAHQPHTKGYKTFFGYFKEDGFKVSKNKRLDHEHKWSTIKEQWLHTYRNKENIAGLSVTQEVTSHDEWCAEAYMETDYTELTKADFVRTIKNYVAFQFLNDDKG